MSMMQKRKKQSYGKLTCFLTLVWIMNLLYGEMIAFWIPSWACSWPQLEKSSQIGNNDTKHGEAIKMAVIADPQLMDHTSHQLSPNSSLLRIAQFYTDLYMKRSFRASILPFKPDVILFLGDLFDGGPFLSDNEWRSSLSRLKHIFNLDQDGKSNGIKVYHISGNHDIGYMGWHSLHPEVINRFENEFGVRNYHFLIGKLRFIAVDSQTLDGPMENPQTSNSWKFVQNVSQDKIPNPKVLLTHIPLYRADGTYCGPYRSSPIINQRISWGRSGQGIMYQNYMTKETSNRLLELIKPALVLSGHDHDQCTTRHLAFNDSVLEETVGTFSWQQGNLYPSFMLLSATVGDSNGTTDPGKVVATELCFLPWQTHIYIWYLSLFIASLLLILFWPTLSNGSIACYNSLISFIERSGINFSNAVSKEKDEDVSCEYDMIWDAEGSMHLVKRPANAHTMAINELANPARGNAVMRVAVKKQTENEARTPSGVALSADFVTVEGSVNFARDRYRSKSKAKVIFQAVVRVVGVVMIVALVNVPLYVILLFKDWIDI